MENCLNELTGSEWLYWTGTLYPTHYPPDPTHQLRKAHGAIKPPGLMAEIISFFTRRGETVLDPFAGVGSTLIGADMVERRAVGFELNPQWVDIYRRIQVDFTLGTDGPIKGTGGRPIQSTLLEGDCMTLMQDLQDRSFAAVITDPPYGCHHRVGFTQETHFAMFNPDERGDFGNAPDFETYLVWMESFGREAYRVLQDRRYLVLLIGDRFQKGEYVPLAVQVAEVMRRVGFRWKGLRIWWNQATLRPLRPYAVKQCFIPNIQHQTILILRKEN
jgi:DNA modification methylase